MSGAGQAPRLIVLGSAVLGLGVSPWLGPPPASLIAAGLAAAGCAWAGGRSRARLGTLVVAAALAGLWVGAARVAAIDAGALTGPAGPRVAVRGFVEAVPRRQEGEVRVRVATADGRLLVTAPEPVGDLPVGHEVVATGTIRSVADWERAYLERLGIARVLEANTVEPTGARRGGPAYFTDRLRERAEVALGRGTPAPEAALLRGFVLGQDDRIDPATVANYQRSGLAHLLAVSGQNVVLLALLAGPVLALLGLGLRARLAGILVLITLYVPMAGAGASIQRAGVMGAAGIVAALASRPASRWYALLLAAAATLAVNPRSTGDVGWQLSFAAVIGIAVWAAPLREALGGRRGSLRGALAEGAAVTVAATLATAPLMAHHFERLSVASLVANLLALPAVAPVMWLGMLAAAMGQLPWLPVEPVTALAGLFAAYITQIAAWTAAPGWAQLEVRIASPWDLAATYAALFLLAWALARRLGRGRRLRPHRARQVLAGLGLVALLALAGMARAGPGQDAPDAGLVVRFLDVGQGDSILLDPRRGDPVLVDAGPADGGAAERLRELGVDRLAAVLVTHADEDHAGGLPSVLSAVDVGAVAWAAADPGVKAAATAAGARSIQVAEGTDLASGGLRLQVQWPPGELVDGDAPPPAEPNVLSVVALARWRDFSVLLTGDAEAEAAHLDPGPVDVLKLAHHGSEDAGLGSLLERTGPALAVASVGAQNPFGHPAQVTLEDLAGQEVPLVRTDLDGEVVIAAGAGGWAVLAGE